jgi:outer membrane cobalamin receptor
VYLDGELLNTEHQGTVDLTTIPVSAIDHIEIIKNGTGNLGKAVAFGGIVNIVTKKATEDKPTTTISFENGRSFPRRTLMAPPPTRTGDRWLTAKSWMSPTQHVQ